MKRRAFLKILSAVPVIATVPALANPGKPDLYRFGESTTDIYDPGEVFSRPENVEPMAWMYRGFEVYLKTIKYRKDAFGKLPFHEYIAINGRQQINLEVDRKRIYLASEDRMRLVNSELDPFIDESNRVWLGKG